LFQLKDVWTSPADEAALLDGERRDGQREDGDGREGPV
jgi:hypothetical protein